MSLKKTFIIALDGPAASGKGTLARKLADHYNLALLDTGILYRAVGWNVINSEGSPEKETDALKAVEKLPYTNMQNPALRGESTGAAASKVAAIPAVREALRDFQRQFAYNPPDDKAGTILDGRDIGTVICPETPYKLFITADVKTRAKRRFLEDFGQTGTEEDFRNILEDLTARDERDTKRSLSPLKKADDALLIDTTNSSIEAVFEEAVSFISGKKVE